MDIDRNHISRYTKSLARRIAIGGALLTLSAGSLAAAPIAARAAGTTLVTGTAVSGAGRWPGASVGAYQYLSSGWHWDGYLTTTNSAGNYSFNAANGYYYQVVAVEQYGSCLSGGIYQHQGASVVFAATGAKVTATVTDNPSLTQLFC